MTQTFYELSSAHELKKYNSVDIISGTDRFRNGLENCGTMHPLTKYFPDKGIEIWNNLILFLPNRVFAALVYGV